MNRIFLNLAVTILMIFLCIPLGRSQNVEIDTSSPFVYPEFSKRISMDFKEATMDNILKIFSQQTGLNFITAESIATRKVTVYLDNVPMEQALEELLRANNLTYEVQPGSNIYLVKPLPVVENQLLTRVYPLKHANVSSAQIEGAIKIEDVTKSPTPSGITETIRSLLTSKGKIVEDPRTNSLIISEIVANFPQIENAISKLDVPVPQILIEVEMLEVTKGTSDLIGNKIGNTPLVLSGANRQNLFPFDLPDNYTWEELFVSGQVNFAGLTATIQFLRTQAGTKTLARPRILTLNNQSAEIRISTDEAISVADTTTSGTGSGISTVSSTVERKKTGVFLNVTPQANLLTGEITLAVSPKVIVARASSISTTGKPIKDTEERGTKALLRVQTGDTVIIGGLMRQDTSKTITKMPLLGDIPFIGNIFRHRDETVSEKELIVFLTPHIINETPVPQATAANIRKLNREQDAPAIPEAVPSTHEARTRSRR